MPDPHSLNDFHIGDRVVIRDWDDMEHEFGLDFEGDIPIFGTYFISDMADLCGREVTISELDEFGGVWFQEQVFDEYLNSYNYTIEMIRPAGCEDAQLTFTELSEEKFVSLLREPL